MDGWLPSAKWAQIWSFPQLTTSVTSQLMQLGHFCAAEHGFPLENGFKYSLFTLAYILSVGQTQAGLDLGQIQGLQLSTQQGELLESNLQVSFFCVSSAAFSFALPLKRMPVIAHTSFASFKDFQG